MSFDSSSSSMPTPTEMRTSCENPEKAEKPREWKKLVDLDEEEWRNIFQERFDRRTGGDISKACLFPFDVFINLLLFRCFFSRGTLPFRHLMDLAKNWRENKEKMLPLPSPERLQNNLYLVI